MHCHSSFYPLLWIQNLNTFTSDDVQEIFLSLDPDLSFFSNTDLHLIFKFYIFMLAEKKNMSIYV